MATPAVTPQPIEAGAETPAQEAFREFIDKQYEALSRGRAPEEHEWFENGLFHQLRQWLERDRQTGRLRPRRVEENKPQPMPVTNHFSMAINRNANALGADIPDMRAMADNYDAKNRRAAEAAERAIIEANRESTFEVLNPILAQQVTLWGISWTKDWIDHSSGAESVESVQTQEVPVGQQCAQCGYNEPVLTGMGGSRAHPTAQSGLPNSTAIGEPQPPMDTGGLGQQACPNCGAPMQPITEQQEVPGEQTQIPVSRIKTGLRTPFEIYVPRDCGDPNLSPLIIEQSRMRMAELQAMYPDSKDDINADGQQGNGNLAMYYLNTLRRLMTSGSSPQEDEADMTTAREAWCKWYWLPQDVQEAIGDEWGMMPSEHPTYSQKGMSKLDAAISFGIYAVINSGKVLEMAECPFEEGFPYTAYCYQKDVASPYPKGLGVEIKPLQKQINRIDSLMIKMAMSGLGKWVIPRSQESQTKPTGDPTDIVFWDDDAGKSKPEFVQGVAQMAALAQLRIRVIQDFDVLANTSSIDRGQAGATTGPFRALAYLGSKAEESRQTTRFLWEQSHEKRARKLLEMCKLAWDEPRKVKVSGPNNKFGMELLDVADLGNGDYSIEVIQDSSRPKTIDEKVETVSMLIQGQFLNPQDPSVRNYIFDTLGMDDVDPANHVSYSKAERDLEMLKQGQPPLENPFINWQIEFLIFELFIQTEEFETMDPMLQGGILMWAGYAQMQISMVAGAAPPPSSGQNQAAGKALAGPTPGQTLHGVAGKGVSPQQQQTAAQQQGNQVVDSLPQEQSTVQ